ncbi:Hypothetical predicted protein [Cloeon dipterum]|uniref:Major facilitator superfamily (MFS) profile domain-containing protein n=1 Tax=Cloeon dipterum TaxID=197152 RepID=A0A8S1DIB8_9INSE|nr:Hypothetical predicted protein [Cloeon dipterum]
MTDKIARTYADEEGHDDDKRRTQFGYRHFVTFMLFLGMANAYIMRTNMSVAIVEMVVPPNLTAADITKNLDLEDCEQDGIEEYINSTLNRVERHDVPRFEWNTKEQAFILSAFFYGYVLTQIPFGLLAKQHGSLKFLGIGMLINSSFGLLVPPAAGLGRNWLIAARFIQGLGEGPIVPCTHALLAKWIPPNERSRMGATVYAGAQFGTVISLPLSGILSASSWGWPSVFYVFGTMGTIWSIFFLIFVREDPEHDKRISVYERSMILRTLGDVSKAKDVSIPWKSIARSLPFLAILLAHMGQNYGYEMLMTELPTFMKQVLHVNIAQNGMLSSLPYIAMWLCSMLASFVADWLIYSKILSIGATRKIFNSFGQYGPGLCILLAAYNGCSLPWTVALLTLGLGFNGGIYSGFKINHLDISPALAGVLMSITNCTANVAGLLAPIVAGYVIHERPTQAAWQTVFQSTFGVYVVCATFFLFASSGERQEWDPNVVIDDIPVKPVEDGDDEKKNKAESPV